MTRSDFLKNYWKYYLLLEKHFKNVERYVTISKDNFETFSIEFVSQLQNIGSEIDVLMKEVCGFNQDERKDIATYCPIILQKYPLIVQQKVNIEELEFAPFEGWETEHPAASLKWWSAYNRIKHGRTKNYKEANLKNVLYALAGLCVLEMFYIKDISNFDVEPDIPDEESRIFQLKNWDSKWLCSRSSFFQVASLQN